MQGKKQGRRKKQGDRRARRGKREGERGGRGEEGELRGGRKGKQRGNILQDLPLCVRIETWFTASSPARPRNQKFPWLVCEKLHTL